MLVSLHVRNLALIEETEVFFQPGLNILTGETGAGKSVILGSVALALVMIFQATHHINFAQGEMAMFSTFIAWSLMQAGLPY